MQLYPVSGPIFMVMFMIAAPTLVQAKPSDWKQLPVKIAKHCNTPVEWLTVSGDDEIRLQPTPEADFNKVDCVLAQLKKYDGIKLGFVGNELDPNAVLTKPYRYIAEGMKTQIQALMAAARAEGWVIVRTADAHDGISFVEFHSRSGETSGGADKLMQRIWRKEFGDLALGDMPRRLSEPYDFDR